MRPRPNQVTGATLPGGPAIVIGSNGRVAWGLTNSGGNWSDLVEIDVDPADPGRYLTPDGSRPFEHHREMIRVKGRADAVLEIRSTVWGPVVGRDHAGRPAPCAGSRSIPRASTSTFPHAPAPGTWTRRRRSPRPAACPT